MLLKVGSKVKFASEKRPYTVQASSERYAVCTKPFNPQHTVLYTVIDFKDNVRGTENLIFGMGAETRELCEEMLKRLTAPCEHLDMDDVICDCRTEVSHRNRIALDIEKFID
jgi:hypothetical protein